MPESELLRELHANLWVSLRHVFNTDRILLAVLYGLNFAGFVMLASVSHSRPEATTVTIASLVLLNCLVALSLNNSKKEALSLTRTLIVIYEDNGLQKYFDPSKLQYYRRRYTLWLILVPTLAGTAIVLGLVIGRGQ